MRITITEQHLDGNDPEGFNTEAWLDALTAQYRTIAADHFPDAEIDVTIDRQRRSSGYARPVSVDFENAEDVPFSKLDAMQTAIEHCGHALYDARGDEFYDAADTA